MRTFAGLVIVGVALSVCGAGSDAPAQGQSAAGVAAEPTKAPAPELSLAEKFKGNPLFDPDFVPIMVNVQSLLNAKIYHDAGINVYDLIDDITDDPKEPYQFKPTAQTLRMLSDLGMYAIVDHKVWGHLKDSKTIIAWECPVDEPDNVQENGKAVPLDDYLTASNEIKTFDPTRPYTTCFGQGLINDRFKGRGIDRTEYPKYMAPVDFIMYDVYPITNARYDDGEKHLELVGEGISRIRGWTDNKKPAICAIETGHIKNTEKAPTPAQTACEVWITMVHGARGTIYFCHDFTLPEKKASALARNKPMLDQLKVTNAKLMKLARIITAPLTTEPATAKSEGDGKVIFSTKKVDGATAVLAVNVFEGKARATIPVAGLKKGAKVEVLEEGRTLEASEDGSFPDDFGPYQEHIYRIK